MTSIHELRDKHFSKDLVVKPLHSSSPRRLYPNTCLVTLTSFTLSSDSFYMRRCYFSGVF